MDGSTKTPVKPRVTESVPAPRGHPRAEHMLKVGEAAKIIGRDPQTIKRWVDSGKIVGGRPTDPLTHQPVPGAHRWVDGRHAILYAIGSGRRHLIPARFRHLIPDQLQPRRRTQAA